MLLARMSTFTQNVDQQLLAVSSLLQDLFERTGKTWQQAMHDALFVAARGVKRSFVLAHEVMTKSLSLIVCYSKRDELPRSRSSFAHSARRV